MNFDPFIIPFNIGLYFILGYSVVRCVRWFMELSRPDKLRLQRGFFGNSFWLSIKEIFLESLLHRRIFKTNFRLGYMHMSLAFGWFLLILFGTIEADIFGTRHLNPPYKAIFFRFFNPEHGRFGFESLFSFLMDMLLAFILSGLLLAVLKRFSSRIVGMKRSARLNSIDKIALTSLWLIFPSRLLAESFTSGAYGTGSFLTGSLGSFLASFLPANEMAYPAWWLYSLSLGTFFVVLPLSRYMHIPTELFLIFARNSGITTSDKSGSFTDIQVYSCSSCGICIDACQMNFSAGITDIQSAYLLKGIRQGRDVKNAAFNCMMCGRCDQKCPVGIELTPIRMIERRTGEIITNTGRSIWKRYFPDRVKVPETSSRPNKSFNYLPEANPEKARLLYYAGCMTHLTPSVIKAMHEILEASGINYSFLDKEGGACCGRPLMLAGQDKEARELINYNSQLIWKSGATRLVTSCPICYKVFKESYYLDVEVLHHTVFIKNLIEDGSLNLKFTRERSIYHSPCELGRGSGIYEEPLEVLKYITQLEKTGFDGSNSLCCGGSLGNIKMSSASKKMITADAVARLTSGNPDILVTSCPLCKKTLSPLSSVPVADISELVANALIIPPQREQKPGRYNIKARAYQT
jgi:Fe-S oxidoreductase